jgi:hypothetical protein
MFKARDGESRVVQHPEYFPVAIVGRNISAGESDPAEHAAEETSGIPYNQDKPAPRLQNPPGFSQ